MKSMVFIGVLACAVTTIVGYILVSDLSGHRLPARFDILEGSSGLGSASQVYFQRPADEGWYVRTADGRIGKLAIEYRQEIFFRSMTEREVLRVDWADSTFSYWSDEELLLSQDVSSAAPAQDSLPFSSNTYHLVPQASVLATLPRFDQEGNEVLPLLVVPQ